MKNIELFDAYSSYIFNELYTNFPKCVNFNDIDEIVAKLDKNSSIEKLTKDLSLIEKNIMFSETMLWLTNNGFIDFVRSEPNTKRPTIPSEYKYFWCVSLSIKGLNLLTSPKPKSINKPKKLGEEVFEKIKQGSFIEAGKMITENMFEFLNNF